MFDEKNGCYDLMRFFVILAFGLFLIGIPASVMGQEGGVVGKEFSSRMVRAGKEFFDRGKFLDARTFFKKAIKADVNNENAWRWYNITLSYALAEQSKKIIYPDVPSSSASDETLPLKKPELVPEMEYEDEDEDMDGC